MKYLFGLFCLLLNLSFQGVLAQPSPYEKLDKLEDIEQRASEQSRPWLFALGSLSLGMAGMQGYSLGYGNLDTRSEKVFSSIFLGAFSLLGAVFLYQGFNDPAHQFAKLRSDPDLTHADLGPIESSLRRRASIQKDRPIVLPILGYLLAGLSISSAVTTDSNFNRISSSMTAGFLGLTSTYVLFSDNGLSNDWDSYLEWRDSFSQAFMMAPFATRDGLGLQGMLRF